MHHPVAFTFAPCDTKVSYGAKLTSFPCKRNRRATIDVNTLVENGVKIDKLNVGGMRMQEGRKSLSRAVAVTPEEEQAFKSLIARNIPVEIQMVPKDPVVDLQTLI